MVMIKRFSLSLTVLTLAAACWHSPAHAAARALVVGIKDYSYWSRLQNSRNDAEDMAQALRDLGFDTTLVVRDDQGEVGAERFRQALTQFSQQLHADDRVIFFYSGHGAAIPSDNGSADGYLIPANTPAVSRGNKQDIKNNAIALKTIAESLSNKIDPDVGSILFMIDACRNEVVNKGADVVEESTPSQPLTKQVEVIYATSNGSTSLDKLPTDQQARNGVFTRVAIDELRRHKNNQGYSSDAFFPAVKSKALLLAKAAGKNQVPAWMNDTGKESFVFVPCPENQPCTVIIDNSTTVNAPASAEMQLWGEIKNSTDAGDYSAYLKQYPDGSFAALAQMRRDKYASAASQSTSILDSLRIDNATKPSVADLQHERDTNPNGTSIYESLSLKTDSKTAILDALRLPDTTADGCGKLALDLNKGTLNGLPPTTSQTRIKQALPCSTGDTEDGADYNYGGGVFFGDHNFYMYTGKDFIEVRRGFKGSVSQNLLSKSKDDVIALYGSPAINNGNKLFYSMPYGCLRFVFSGSSVSEIGVHAQRCGEAVKI